MVGFGLLPQNLGPCGDLQMTLNFLHLVAQKQGWAQRVQRQGVKGVKEEYEEHKSWVLRV